MATTYIGIDPGCSGAIAVISADGTQDIRDMPVHKVTVGSTVRTRPDWRGFRDMIELFPTDTTVVVYEESPPFSAGLLAVHLGGQFIGGIKSAMVWSGHRSQPVRPNEWKKRYGLTRKAKGNSIVKACELFPMMAGRIGKNDNRAEALLMADYARWKDGGN